MNPSDLSLSTLEVVIFSLIGVSDAVLVAVAIIAVVGYVKNRRARARECK